MKAVGVIVVLELRQRVRAVSWYVLLGVFILLVAFVTVLLSIALFAFGAADAGGGVFSTIILFVLLLGSLVTPALSGSAINGDREAGTLATTQVTLVTTWQLVLGKFLAAWVSALAFLAAAAPFLVYATIVGHLGVDTTVVALLVLVVELGVIAAIGVGLSGIISRSLFSIVLTYLVVAALSVGTLIAFTLGGLVIQSEVRSTSSYATSFATDGAPVECSEPQVSVYRTPRFDLVWVFLAANPYVVLADAVPTQYDQNGFPTDLFGNIKLGVRAAQKSPDLDTSYSECDGKQLVQPTGRETIESTAPGWFVGLLVHLVLAPAALTAAWASTRTPAARLARGSRVA